MHDHKQTGGILLGERKQQNFLRLRRKQEGLWPSIAQPKGTKPREIRTLGVRRKVELRLQRADRQQTKKTKKKTKETKDASSESVDSIYLWKCISHITMMMYHTCMRSFDDVI